MRPSIVLLGFVLGSSAAISFSLLGVAIVFWLLQGDHPRLESEIGPLLRHLAIFLGLTLVAGLSFYAMLRAFYWRHVSVAALFAMLVGIGFYYWPD